MDRIDVKTRDGSCPTYVFRPSGSGAWPAVIVFMDGLGIRPAVLDIGSRLAEHGYYVLLPDLYYRSGPYEPMDPHAILADPAKRAVLTEKFMALASPADVMSDTRSLIDCLDAHSEAKSGRMGVTGYCRGGLMSLTAAGTFPSRIAAAASYHGGRLATDAPDSPHLLAEKMQARIYIAGAIEDPSFPDDMKRLLQDALVTASVDHTIETYQAKHGWVLHDMPAYDAAAAERHWETLLALFGATLK